jgi:hypothetical protein
MATRRRRYPVKRQGYKSGGAVIPDDVLPGFGREEHEVHATPPAEPAPAPAAHHPADDDAVANALTAQRLAEQMQVDAMRRVQAEQQPAQQQMTVEQWIASQPWSDRRKDFVNQHRELLLPQNAEAVESYWKMARRLGITDEAEVDRYVLNGLSFERGAREALEERAHNPRREEAEDAPDSPAPPQARREALPPALSEPRRSIPMTAPVHREAPTMSGKRMSSNNSMRLTEEERKIARESFVDRPEFGHLTDAQKEYMYAQQKARYEEMRRNGTYTDQRQR